jgi:hypothetical protein
MEALGQELMRDDSLEDLSVGFNKFGIVGLTPFAAGLKKPGLFGNSVGDAGAAIMAAALTSDTSVTKLAPETNNIGDEGAVAWGEAPMVNTSFES